MPFCWFCHEAAHFRINAANFHGLIFRIFTGIFASIFSEKKLFQREYDERINFPHIGKKFWRCHWFMRSDETFKCAPYFTQRNMNNMYLVDTKTVQRKDLRCLAVYISWTKQGRSVYQFRQYTASTLFWFFYYGQSRLFHSVWAESVIRWGENGRSPRKITSHPQAELGLSCMSPELGSWDGLFRTDVILRMQAERQLFGSFSVRCKLRWNPRWTGGGPLGDPWTQPGTWYRCRVYCSYCRRLGQA